MCALVESLLGHRQATIHSLEPLEDADGSGSLVGTTKVAARIQAAGELVDWLGTARIALQVSLPLACRLFMHWLEKPPPIKCLLAKARVNFEVKV